MRKENGITLIALMLIVLLILIVIGVVVVIFSSDSENSEQIAGSVNSGYEVIEDIETENENEEPKFDAESMAEYLNFEFNDDEKTATITGIKEEYSPKDSEGNSIPKHIVVDGHIGRELNFPSEVEKDGKKYKVTKIGEKAFYDDDVWGSYSEITKVVIQEGVEEIGDYAFYNNGSLTEL